MPKVSVIMGVYNCEKTINESIDSILSQTFDDWEFVICDDGSTDDTYSIIVEYASNFPEKFVILKNKENMGLNHTLNRCLKESNGEYIARMDGDDISLPDRFEKEVDFLDKHSEYSIVSTPMIFFDENGDWGKNVAIEKPTKHDFIRHSPIHCHAPCMIRKSAYFDVGGYTEDERMLRCEDVNLWYKLYSQNHIGYNLNEPLYKMRDDKNALRRRSFKSRMNFVYTTYVGFRLFEFPTYMYIYVGIEFFENLIKSIMPKRLYLYFHKKSVNAQ